MIAWTTAASAPSGCSVVRFLQQTDPSTFAQAWQPTWAESPVPLLLDGTPRRPRLGDDPQLKLKPNLRNVDEHLPDAVELESFAAWLQIVVNQQQFQFLR